MTVKLLETIAHQKEVIDAQETLIALQAARIEKLELFLGGLTDAHKAIPEWLRRCAREVLVDE